MWLLYVFFALVFAVFFACFIAYFRAQRPKTGTLEWISFVDKPPFSFGCDCCPIGKKDVLPMLGCAVLAAVCCCGTALRVLPPHVILSIRTPYAISVAALHYIVAPIAAVLGLYAFLRRLTGKILPAALSAALLALDLQANMVLLAFWMPSLAFMLRYLGKSGRAGTVSCGLELTVIAAILAVGSCARIDVLLLVPVVWVAVLFARICHTAREKTAAQVFRCVGAAVYFPIVTAFFVMLTRIPSAAAAGAFTQNGIYYKTLWSHIVFAPLLQLALMPMQFTLQFGVVEIAAAGCALFALAACVHTLAARRDVRALLVLWLFAAFAVFWSMGVCPVLAGSLPMFALCWAKWRERENSVFFWLTISVLFALYLGALCVLWI